MEHTATNTKHELAASPLDGLFERARKALIQTDSRNRLIHTPRGNRRSKSISIVDEDADETFRRLVRETRKLTFQPASAGAEDDDEEAGTGVLIPVTQDDTNHSRVARASATNRLQTRLSEEVLQRKLLTLQRDAKSLEEEQGVDVLYLAVGFLRWFEDKNSDIPREAPLVLLPVTLERDSARSSMRLVRREADIETNLSLQEKLKEFGISLPDIEDEEDWCPSSYFSKVSQAIATQPRWSVDANGMVLGFFSFSKFLMFRDLIPAHWPGQSILSHLLLDGLLASGFDTDEPLTPDDAKLDQVMDTANLNHVVDADASQTLVVEDTRVGRNLVVQGPPGTGKSQTITNVIAGAVHDGKTVLFVAEKLAALKVVHERLSKVGLAPICLELHSRSANKRAVALELERTLRGSDGGASGPALAERLRSARDRLNQHSALMHEPLSPSNVSPFQALADLVHLRSSGHDVPKLALPDSVQWSPTDWKNISGTLERLARRTRTAGPAVSHPWRGVTGPDLQPTDQERLTQEIKELILVTRDIQRQIGDLSGIFGFDPDPAVSDISRIVRLVEHVALRPIASHSLWEAVIAAGRVERLLEIASIGLSYQAAREPVISHFVETALEADLGAHRAAISSGAASWFSRWSARYRRASRELAGLLKVPLPRSADERLRLVDTLMKAHQLGEDLAVEAGFAASILQSEWRGQETDFVSLRDSAAWLSELNGPEDWDKRRAVFAEGEAKDWTYKANELRACHTNAGRLLGTIERRLGLVPLAAFGVPRVDNVRLSGLIARAELWGAQVERLNEWQQLRAADAEARTCGISVIADCLADGCMAPERAPIELRYARAEALWKQAAKERPTLTSNVGDEYDDLVGEFRSLEEQRRGAVAKSILSHHSAGKPTGGMGDMAIIRGEINRQRGHMPVRKLLARAGRTIQRIKPVFLMSPLSIAQFLEPGAVDFDLLVIDEASQVKPEDALGAIARARQIVVVGDKQQLPPTTFFDRAVSDDSTDQADDEPNTPLAGGAFLTAIESILGLCETRGLPQRLLRWHYRSRHPSLIEVSNREFYEERLFMPPSPITDRDAGGLSVTHVLGAYDRGGKRTNKVEAEAVIAAAEEHARTLPGLSLGVVTFSAAQKALIDDLIEVAKRRNPEFDEFVRNPKSEGFFVKNLENVQGDERDVIFISIGYGPRIAGQPLDSMTFGPVSAEGGERRLNVLFTRAKRQCRVFVSFHSGDIKLERVTQSGPRVLQRFLQYAESGLIDQAMPTGQDPDSPFEEAVARAIKGLGYEVEHQVGSAGFRIDLAVRDPNRPSTYLMAVECDGATYHSAQWARERDRLRQEILEGLGWRFYRVWSTDWFRTPEAASRKLAAALAGARSEASQPAVEPSEQPAALPIPVTSGRQSVFSAPVEHHSILYPEASFRVDLVGIEIHEMPVDKLSTIVARIVVIEAPIHEEEIARRTARLMGKDRAGGRIVSSVRGALRHAAQKGGTIYNDGPFWFPMSSDWRPKVRDRSNASIALQKADMIAGQEIEVAIEEALTTNGRLPREQVAVAVSRLFGFQRTGSDLRHRIDSIITEMVKKKRVVDEAGQIRMEA